MGKLTNNLLRTENMILLLKNMGINLENTEVVCHDDLVVFKSSSEEIAQELSINLQSFLEDEFSNKPPVVQFSLGELITKEIEMSYSSDQETENTYKESCNAELQILIKKGLKYTSDEQQEHIEIKLPSEVYTPLFSSLNYKYLSILNDKIRFNVKGFLKVYPNELVIIKNDRQPLIYASANFFEKKKVFYAQKVLSNGTLEVTPYFFIPHAPLPPEYHFVLDTSGSMDGERLAALKKSVIKLSKALFQFQPEATINITEFNGEIKLLDNYKKEEISQLKQDVKSLTAKASTCLYEVSFEKLSMIMQSKHHNNILLFTDGKDESMNPNHFIQELEQSIHSLEKNSSKIRARNKFFIISYGTTQPEILHRLTNLFASPVIDSKSVDFIKALSNVNRMHEWAALRELFKFQLVVDDETNEYVCAYDMSGQFTALKPQLSKDGNVHLIVTDSSGKVLLDDKRSLIKKKEPVSLNIEPVDVPEITENNASPAQEVTPLKTDTPSISQYLMQTMWANKKTIVGASVALVTAVTAYSSL